LATDVCGLFIAVMLFHADEVAHLDTRRIVGRRASRCQSSARSLCAAAVPSSDVAFRVGIFANASFVSRNWQHDRSDSPRCDIAPQPGVPSGLEKFPGDEMPVQQRHDL